MQQSLDSPPATHSHPPPPTLKFPCLKSYTQNLTSSTSPEVAFIQRKGAGYLTVGIKEEIWRLFFLMAFPIIILLLFNPSSTGSFRYLMSPCGPNCFATGL